MKSSKYGAIACRHLVVRGLILSAFTMTKAVALLPDFAGDPRTEWFSEYVFAKGGIEQIIDPERRESLRQEMQDPANFEKIKWIAEQTAAHSQSDDERGLLVSALVLLALSGRGDATPVFETTIQRLPPNRLELVVNEVGRFMHPDAVPLLIKTLSKLEPALPGDSKEIDAAAAGRIESAYLSNCLSLLVRGTREGRAAYEASLARIRKRFAGEPTGPAFVGMVEGMRKYDVPEPISLPPPPTPLSRSDPHAIPKTSDSGQSIRQAGATPIAKKAPVDAEASARWWWAIGLLLIVAAAFAFASRRQK